MLKIQRPQCRFGRGGGVRPPANFESLAQGKGGLVAATPWDANMDAEQKLKGRVSVDQWMVATTAHCQQHTGDGFSIQPHLIQDDWRAEATKEERRSSTDPNLDPGGFFLFIPRNANAASATLNFSLVWFSLKKQLRGRYSPFCFGLFS